MRAVLSASRTSKCMFLAVQRTTKLRKLGRWILVVQSAYWHCAQASHQPRDAVCRRSQLITHATKTWQYCKQGPVVIIGLLSNGLTFKPAVLQAAGAGGEQGMWIACSWLKLGNEPPELSQQPAWQADCELTDEQLWSRPSWATWCTGPCRCVHKPKPHSGCFNLETASRCVCQASITCPAAIAGLFCCWPCSASVHQPLCILVHEL